MNVFNTLIENYLLVKNDFVGFSFNIVGVGEFFLHVLIAGGIFILFYLFGEKIRTLFFKENKQYTFFINIALGYIVIGTGIGLLGVLSLLKPEILWTYFISVIFVAFYPFHFPYRHSGADEGARLLDRGGRRRSASRISLKSSAVPLEILDSARMTILRKMSVLSGKNKFIYWGVLLFVLIAFLRLMTPEITEDGYHTDLPRFYLATQTSIHESRDLLHVIPYPQLAEMIYLIPIFLGDKEAVRFIHFGFYLLIIFLLFAIGKNKKQSFVTFAPLLFVTAPIVIRYSPSQYVDFFMVYSFLLAILLIGKGITTRTVVLSGILFGSMLSIKMWTLIYMPAMLVYIYSLNKQINKKLLVKLLLLFVVFALCVPLLWYIRSFLITGNPVYPIFSKIEYLDGGDTGTPTTNYYFGFNSNMFAPQNMVVYSPLFFLGVVFVLLNLRAVIKQVKHFSVALFFVILMIEQLVIRVDLGRYLIAWYSTAITVVSAGLTYAIPKNLIARVLIVFVYVVLFSYYFINTLFMLPYGWGWADKNSYLTRVLGRDNASYYDFDRLFDKEISEKDVVATDGIVNFYYADFRYIDIGYVFSKDERSFDLLYQKGATKLLVKGGDIQWFCKRLSLTHCDENRVKLLASWPENTRKYNLYELRNR